MNIDGIWKVIGKSGILRFLLGDVKYIKDNKGYNRLFGIKWGHFTISYDDDEIIFTYADGHTVDRLKVVTNDLLSGELYCDEKFIGKFEMKRIKK